MKVRKK